MTPPCLLVGPRSPGAESVTPVWWWPQRAMVASVAVILLLACGGGSESAPITPPLPPPPIPTGPVGPLVVGQVYTDQNGWVEYTPGDAPLVIMAPHGGTVAPTALPDRACGGCVTTNDLNTQELARAVVSAFQSRTGMRPHLVVNRLHRRKFDGNRDRVEATGGATALDASWVWWHEAIDSARAAVVRRAQRGLIIDLHGHAHPVPRLELGYLLDDATLRSTDAVLSASGAMTRSSVARLAGDTRSSADRGAALLRGPRSLGALLGSLGFPAVPSPTDPAPLVGQEYFDGGYNTARHGSLNGGAVDAIQIECHLPGVRDTEANRAAFAAALSAALTTWFDVHYGWRGPTS